MDPDRWKSVAVPISVWEMLKKLSDKEDRSIGGTIAWLTKKEINYVDKDNIIN
jgi:hypothetical protein|tara:strand:- start:577 stop:735 length:159 start_codon:yes stop_codon:yes gene_type:complete